MPDSSATDFVATALTPKPELVMHGSNLPSTAAALADLLAAGGDIFERVVPVRVVKPAGGGVPLIAPLTKHNVVVAAHRFCQPIRITAQGDRIPVTLSDRVAELYLSMAGAWRLAPLSGISTTPLLSAGGGIRAADGYDAATGLWCADMPVVDVSPQVSESEADIALQLLRQTFRTFPFADAKRLADTALGVDVVDLRQPPGLDESSFLVSLMTAVCRPSLWLAPGTLLTSPDTSGAGSGKGLLVRAMAAIAFGQAPYAFTAGDDKNELDKRLAAALVAAAPMVFVDNVNGTDLNSNTLASVLTERPAQVRILGRSRMVPLNSTAFIAVTGNGLAPSEDLVRRFILCEFDAHCENPELRPFADGFVEDIARRRVTLLEAVLTIWRWGRQNAGRLQQGRALGGFGEWASWVRDPLISLGCRDPIERLEATKAHDPRRVMDGEIFRRWWVCHQDTPVTARGLDGAVQVAIDPKQEQRAIVWFLTRHVGSRVAGFVLTRQEPARRHEAATYTLRLDAPAAAAVAAATAAAKAAADAAEAAEDAAEAAEAAAAAEAAKAAKAKAAKPAGGRGGAVVEKGQGS